MEVELLFFDGCPGWQEMAEHLDALAGELGFAWTPVPVETPEAAEARQFHGSPSLQIDGRDPFAAPDAPVGLSCRMYATPGGRSGSPGRQAVRDALLDAASADRLP